MAKLKDLIEQHLAYYKDYEKNDFDRARSYYRGDFWETFEKQGSTLDARMSSMYAQKNLIYAITDTAISSLLGPNPQVAAMPQNPDGQDLAGATNGLMEWAFRTVNMRRRSALSLMDAVLCKRGVFKVSWDSKKDAPVVSNPNPASVFFDLSARDNDDIRCWIQACALTPPAVQAARADLGRPPLGDIPGPPGCGARGKHKRRARSRGLRCDAGAALERAGSAAAGSTVQSAVR